MYARRKGVLADVIVEHGDGNTMLVELKDRRRVRWKKNGAIALIEFGSLNPKNANYRPGGKVLRTV